MVRGLRITGSPTCEGSPVVVTTPRAALAMLRRDSSLEGGPRPMAVVSAYTEWLLERFDLRGNYPRLGELMDELREMCRTPFTEQDRVDEMIPCTRFGLEIEALRLHIRQGIHGKAHQKRTEMEWTEEIRILLMEAFATSKLYEVEVIQ